MRPDLYKTLSILLITALAASAVASGIAADPAPLALLESARQVPVAAEADVVVVGGSTGAVAAAVAAAKRGAKVFLAAPRHYLGEDMAGTLQLWLEPVEQPRSALALNLFAPTEQHVAGLPLSYKADQPSAGRHKDTSPPSLLNDGRWTDPVKQSVQYDSDVTIRIDLRQSQPLKAVRGVVFRGGDYAVESMSVAIGEQSENLREAGLVKCDPSAANPIILTLPLTESARYLKCTFKKAAGASRVLLGEVIVDPAAPSKGPQGPRSTTPLAVKRALDHALTEAGVQLLYGSYATDLLKDEQGRPAGVVLANRSGRQAVLAKVVVDASPSATIARLAGAELRGSAQGRVAAHYVVLAKEARPVSPRLTVRKLNMPVEGGKTREKKASIYIKDGVWYEYTVTLDLPDASWAARANLTQTVRDLTYTTWQLYSADEPYFVPPQTIRAVKPAAAGPIDPERIELDAFRPVSVPQIWVLGPSADVPRDQAEKLLRPMTSIEIGARVGTAAASEARGLPAPQGAHVARASSVVIQSDGDVRSALEFRLQAVNPAKAGTPTNTASLGEVRELLGGLHASPAPRSVPQPAGALPVLGRYDVVVIGGGTSGAPAGIAAARQHAKTLVIEYQSGLGGVGTLGMIGGFWYGNRVGFVHDVPQSPTEVRMEWYRSELRKAGADVWFATLGCGAVTEDHRVRGVVVATPYGRGVVLAKNVVDATGSADTAIAAGAQFTYVEDDFALQMSHLPSRNPGQSYLNGNLAPIDDTNPWNVGLVVQDKLRTTGRDFDIGQLMDTRERRRIVGDFCLDWLDVINQRTFPDSVVHSCSDYDSHGYQIHPFFTLTHVPPRHKFWAYVPYRCLLPKGLDGILVVGIAMSGHRDAMPITRMQPDQTNLGYAAGVAAAMAGRQGITPRQVDVKALQRHLVAVGNLPASVLTHRDSFPLPTERVNAAVKTVTKDYQDVQVLLAQPNDSIPLLKEAYAGATGRDKTIFAHVLAAMGDPTGVPTLLEAIRADNIPAANPRLGSGGRCGMIRAIGLTRDRRAVPLLIELSQGNQATSDFQLLRSLSVALGRIGDPAAAPALAKLLEKIPSTQGPSALLVACALYRCGDHENKARQWLQRCAQQDVTPLARLAWQVLSSPRNE